MEREPTVLNQLANNGILRQGHFAFRTGRHSNALIDRDLLLADPSITSKIGYHISRRFFTSHIEAIVTPSIWGAGLAQWVAYFLEPRGKVVEATLIDDRMTIAPKLVPLVEGKRVLLVDKLVLSGHTMSELVETTSRLHATIVGIAALWSSAGDSIGDRELYSVLNRQVPAWVPSDCPLCANGAGPAEPVDF